MSAFEAFVQNGFHAMTDDSVCPICSKGFEKPEDVVLGFEARPVHKGKCWSTWLQKIWYQNKELLKENAELKAKLNS
jgi:hypothetical protein